MTTSAGNPLLLKRINWTCRLVDILIRQPGEGRG